MRICRSLLHRTKACISALSTARLGLQSPLPTTKLDKELRRIWLTGDFAGR